MTMPPKSKYKTLHGAVRSFSEGITGIICSGFQELARHAVQSNTSGYRLDFLDQTSVPDIPMTVWRQWLFTYFDLNEWFDAIGCSLAHIRKVEMDAAFDMSSIEHTASETCVYVNAVTVFEDDRGKRHVYQERTPVFFRREHGSPNKKSQNSPPPILRVSKDAVRKLMRHGWNVYPLEAFGFLLGTVNPPCVHAALPTSKTAQWDSHDDRWNALQERRPVADEVAALFDLQVVGVYATHEHGDAIQPFPAAFADGIVITYAFDWGTNEAGVWGAALHAPGIGRGDWSLSRGKRLLPEFNHRRVLATWRTRVGPIDYSNNYKTEYPRLFGIQPHKQMRYAPPKKPEPEPYHTPLSKPSPHSLSGPTPSIMLGTYHTPSSNPSPHSPPQPDPLDRWNASQRVSLNADFPLTEEQQIILAAIRNQTALTFRYIGGSRPGDIRTARPKELFHVAGYPGCYMLANDLALDEGRVFRLDRIDWQQ